MKFKFGKKAEKKREPVVRLEFQSDGNNGVNIVAIMENEDEWYLLALNADGTFSRYASVEASSGFKVSKNGYLKERK